MKWFLYIFSLFCIAKGLLFFISSMNFFTFGYNFQNYAYFIISNFDFYLFCFGILLFFITIEMGG